MATPNSTALPVPSRREVLLNGATMTATSAFGPLSRSLVALFTAMASLAPTVTVLAQAQGTATARAAKHNANRPFCKGTKMTSTVTQLDTTTDAIRPFHIHFPQEALDEYADEIADAIIETFAP